MGIIPHLDRLLIWHPLGIVHACRAIRRILTNSSGSLHSNSTALFCQSDSEGTCTRSISLRLHGQYPIQIHIQIFQTYRWSHGNELCSTFHHSSFHVDIDVHINMPNFHNKSGIQMCVAAYQKEEGGSQFWVFFFTWCIKIFVNLKMTTHL